MLYTRDKLLKAAQFTTGLSDFGSNDFVEPLDLLIEGYQTTADLNWKGVAGSWIYLHRMLCNRLRLNHYLSTSNAESEQVSKPIFILGLPRTGSTLLHELMSVHPDLRAPLFWEATFVPGKSPMDHVRQWITQAQIGVVDLLAPGFRSVHRLGTRLPHECITLQALSFRTMQFHAAHNLTAYNQWLETCDWMPAYQYHQKYLQWLQQGSRSHRWVLKAPGHLLSLPALMTTYPDATLIQLHRDPAEVIPSMASLYLHLRRPFSKRVDLHEIGADVTRQWEYGLHDASEFRRNNPHLETQIIDINYRDLVSKPLEVISNLLKFAEIEPTPSTETLFNNYLQDNPKGKHGTHNYTLAQFGLSAEDLSARFRDYNRQFQVA